MGLSVEIEILGSKILVTFYNPLSTSHYPLLRHFISLARMNLIPIKTSFTNG